ncbi:alpha-N-acetylglucosaminidase (NAGLU) tim-barrel domain-containing protein [Hirsutella rhossiliensis]|uniref:Alpha-N-acetylglucosaminidase (NAGLU) tim-barrel domain-containing protein n=1 Tax=Hirsutella rhossiliensis TaxID=111463 RepID=A0A9P8N6A3_9HYPO|nr:alpha-N-acetylglucosaminidase (NAGLU) tim-barrel domain-containing protein [Hirsutella rhossiliensis]KAH0968428.1 alpha-N-acetylglucosaminidase (NAGLU) tim-barrel domain-containing protein [Hirsutella rhossiliensis]
MVPNRLLSLLTATALMSCSPVLAHAPPPTTTDGIKGLADRLLPGQGDSFDFVLTARNDAWSRWNPPTNDHYTVAGSPGGRIRVEGTTLSALARGLRHYATETLQLDDFWFVDNCRNVSGPLPTPKGTLTGSSVVPWRYNLNTVTFSYTFAWYTWADWEKLLDWAAWRGVNLQLAWVGYEKIFLDSFRALGLADDEIVPFFSGPAFQAWNRFGNIKGSWGGVGGLPLAWIDAQFELQRRIVARMVELGITPVLPAFPGFVPDAIRRVRPSANVTRAPVWGGVPEQSRDYFLSPLDDTFAELQHAFVSRQMQAFGNVTNFYTLDQFNELTTAEGDGEYLSGVSRQTYRGLTEANPAAVWLMQGWLFYSSKDYWTQERIDAYLGGVPEKQSMLILDLYSENEPQWQRTRSYAGRPWIWWPVLALDSSDSLVGFGLTPEAYEGNEVVYDLLLDQAWSRTAIEAKSYFRGWTRRRYSEASSIPPSLFEAWDLLRAHVYDNKDHRIPCAGVGVYQLAPSLSGLVNRTFHFPAPTALHYDPEVLKEVWGLMLDAAAHEGSLWEVPTFQLDVVDVTRQVMSNAFIDIYTDLVRAYNDTMQIRGGSRPGGPRVPSREVSVKGQTLLDFLDSLDLVLSTQEHFTLDKWLGDAQRWAKVTGADELISFNARSQVTVWIWESPFLNDYSARAWAGLTRSYYRPRWSLFVEGLKEATARGSLDEKALNAKIRAFEKEWQYGGFGLETGPAGERTRLRDTLMRVQRQWPSVFARRRVDAKHPQLK